MKQIYTLSLILFSFTAFSQQRNVNPNTNPPAVTDTKNAEAPAIGNTRNPSGSVQAKTSPATPLPYDMEDKYMGRKAEFLGNLTVSELPADFPVYEKQWDLKTYNQVVTAFYYNHLDIVREPVKKKLELLQH